MDAWILVATTLVIFMAIPGVALFYGGLVSAKNVVAILTQSITIVGVVTLTLLVAGNAIMSNGFDFQAIAAGFLLLGVGQEDLHNTVFAFTFAIITPILIVGGFAERVKFAFVLVFSALWTLLVYCPLAYWVWVAPEHGNLLTIFGTTEAMDWAGGLVVHQSAGVAAIVLALVIGRRKSFAKPTIPHNPTMVFIGASVLWIGWFGFNAGLNDGLANAGHIILNTHVAAAMGALTWPLVETLRGGKPTLVGATTGAVAGLVAITPACHDVSVAGALVLGVMAGTVPQILVRFVKDTLKIDDSLDVFAIHGIAGIVGTLLLPFLALWGDSASFSAATLAANEAANALVASQDGDSLPTSFALWPQYWGQVAAVVISFIYNLAVTLVLALGLKWSIGMRVDAEIEADGLDVSVHGERGYNP